MATRLLALVAALLGLARASAAPLRVGSGELTLPNDGVPIRVFSYKPATYAGGPILPEELSNDDALRRYCAEPLTLYLGTGDAYQKVSDGFDFSALAMKQGPVRLARNHNFYQAMKALAVEHGWPFHWRIVETPDIEHNGARMFHVPEVDDALLGK